MLVAWFSSNSLVSSIVSYRLQSELNGRRDPGHILNRFSSVPAAPLEISPNPWRPATCEHFGVHIFPYPTVPWPWYHHHFQYHTHYECGLREWIWNAIQIFREFFNFVKFLFLFFYIFYYICIHFECIL